MRQLFSDFYNIFSMFLAAFISFFFALIFRGGPQILYQNNKFVFRRFAWLFAIQFFGAIAVFIITLSIFANGGILEQYSHYGLLLAFIFGILPIEITMVLLMVTIHRIWLIVIKKIDPNFEETDPLDKIKSVIDFTDERKERVKDDGDKSLS